MCMCGGAVSCTIVCIFAGHTLCARVIFGFSMQDIRMCCGGIIDSCWRGWCGVLCNDSVRLLMSCPLMLRFQVLSVLVCGQECGCFWNHHSNRYHKSRSWLYGEAIYRQQ